MFGWKLARPFALGICSLALAALPVQASSLTPGNIVVVRVGDGSTTLNGNASAVFLDEYTPAGGFVQTIALPTSGNTLTNAGSATSEGFLNLSVDNQYLIQAGYKAVPGTAAVATSTSAAVNRVIGRTDMNGNVDTTTALTDAYSGGNIRAATSDDGTHFWTSGTSATSGSVRYIASVGATTSTQLSTTPTNTRVVRIQNGQLYVSSASLTFQGVSTVGTGVPTTSGQTITILPGFPTAAGPSNYDYFFADANTLYVADDRTNGSGGIQKWTLSGGTWTLQYTLAVNATTGCRGLTGDITSGQNVLWATTAPGAGAIQVVTVTDTGAGSLFTPLVTAATNTALRGIRHIPTPCVGAHIAQDPTDASACLGSAATFTVTAGGDAPFTYQWRLNTVPLSDGGDVSGAHTKTLTIHPVSNGDLGSYDCVVTNACGTATSNTAQLTLSTADSDGDGTPDCSDGCPNDPNKIAPGICGCGVSDVDTDGDGTPDCHDGCPTDPTKVAPGICGCGVADTDTDGDGTPDCNDGCPNDRNKIAPGQCGCGVPDTDTDGDGTADCHDGCPNDRTKIAPGQCGCGVPDTDSDGDGTADCHDGCPNDRNKIAPGICGCGISDADTDGDGIADCHDNCPGVANPGQQDVDGDGIGDACDNCVHIPNHDQADCNGNGVGDACEIAAGAPDCNFNGVPDSCDIANHTSADANGNGIPDECELNGGTPFCFGDGHPNCPCSNNSASGAHQGCLNSTGQGGKLLGSGITKVSADGFSLHASNMIQGVCVFLQGDSITQAPFGDGLRCASGQLIRLATKSVVAGGSSYPQTGDPTISVKGLVPPGGGVRYYQVFYRNPNGSPCGTFFNITSGVNVIWQP
jgi:hypothetical protein